MHPIPATADAMQLLATWGDDTLRVRIDWIGETLAALARDSHALAVRFADEDMTLVLVDPQYVRARHAHRATMRSSLALRIAERTRPVATVTIYSTRPGAFSHDVGRIEAALGAVVGASVLDDDLTFDAALRAESAPAQLRARWVEETALGVLMGRRQLTVDEAEDWLDRITRSSGRARDDIAARVVAAHSATSPLARNPRT